MKAPLLLPFALVLVPAFPSPLAAQEEGLPPLPAIVGDLPVPAASAVSPSALIANESDERTVFDPSAEAPIPVEGESPDESGDEAEIGIRPSADSNPALAVAEPGKATPAPGDAAGSTGGAAGEITFLQRSNLIITMILENERAIDPFGLPMDPANAKATPVLAEQYQEEAQPTALNSSALKSALMTLPITGVYPKREVIVIGARAFPIGGQFGMKLQDLTIRLRFEGIRGGEIYFKDMETREVTSVPFNTRPAEFEPLNKENKPETGAGISAMGDLFIAN